MDAYKFVKLKKEEFGISEYIKRQLGKGKISRLDIEYTPVGEKIIISTSKPGLVIGRKGEQIQQLTEILKKRFKLENPHIEISEIEQPLFDAQGVADEIALALERMGNLKFKVIAYRKLQEIMKAGALGCEMRLTGKLPSERAKSWRFAEGYLKKAGDSAKEVDRAQATALTKTGIIGVKVAIMPPTAKIYDRIVVDDAMRAKLGMSEEGEEEDSKNDVKKKTGKSTKDKKSKSGKPDTAAEKVALAAGEVAKAEEEKDEAKKQDKETIEDATEPSTKGVRETPEVAGDAMAIEEEIEEGVTEEDDKAIESSQVDEKIEESESNVNKEAEAKE
jgi:small subunit ribosomal protein S3